MCFFSCVIFPTEWLCTLYCVERPDPPIEAVVTEVKSRSVSLKLVAGLDGGSLITRFIAQYKQRNEDWRLAKNFTLDFSTTNLIHGHQQQKQQQQHQDFILRDLRPSQTYIIRFFAVNDIGTSEPSKEIVIETLDEGTKIYRIPDKSISIKYFFIPLANSCFCILSQFSFLQIH